MKDLTERLRAVEKSYAESILAAIGAKPQVEKHHQRCPFPAHEDRNPSFRYDPEIGRVFCTCLGEQGASLTDALMKARGIDDFNDAVREIEAITGERIVEKCQTLRQSESDEQEGPEGQGEVGEQAVQREIEDSGRIAAAAKEKAAKIAWVQAEVAKMRALSGTPAEKYLREVRGLDGIDLDHESLRYTADFRCKPGGTKAQAMVAIVTDGDGKIVGMQGTLLKPNGQPVRDKCGRKKKLSAGYIGDGAVRIQNKLGTGTVAISEGLETGLTRLLAGPAEIMVCLGPIRPETAQAKAGRVEIIADSDKAQECRQIARQLAAENPNSRVYVVTMPASLGKTADLNDLLQDMGQRAVAVDEIRMCLSARLGNRIRGKGRDQKVDRVLQSQAPPFRPWR